MRIYVSSTFTDLAEHRAATKRVIESLKDDSFKQYGQDAKSCFEYIGLEYLSADTQPPLDTCLEEIVNSDIFILLIGWRYGYIPEGCEKSVVELEYQTAIEKNIPALCYIIDDNYPLPAKFIDTSDSAVKLRKFKERVKNDKFVKYFGSPDDLAQKITADLSFCYQRIMHTPMSEIAKDVISKIQIDQKLQNCERDNAIYVSTINSLRKKIENIVPAEPIWSTRNFKIDTTLGFVLIPFQEDFLCIYEAAILPALNNAGLRGTHAGEIFDNREIVEDIWESICTSKIIVADVSGKNPNVFYELGICHTLGKEVIVITQNDADVPFDIRHLRYIHYEKNKLSLLKSNLEKTIKRVILKTKAKD